MHICKLLSSFTCLIIIYNIGQMKFYIFTKEGIRTTMQPLFSEKAFNYKLAVDQPLFSLIMFSEKHLL
jgi:hypothetical protein